VTLRAMPSGNHMTTGADARRPVLSARVNLAINSALTGAIAGTPGTTPTGWTNSGFGGAIDSVTDDGEGNNVLALSATGARQMYERNATVETSQVYDFSIALLATSGLVLQQLATVVSLPVGATAQYIADGAVVAGTVTATAGQRIGMRVTISTTAGAPSLRFGIGCQSNGTGTASFARPQVVSVTETGALPYQRTGVNAATGDYDTTGFPLYLRFDGVDDALITNINFSATDKVTVVGGVRKFTAVGTVGVVLELSVSRISNNGTFTLIAPGTSDQYFWASKGTVDASATTTSATYAAPNTAVVGMVGDISGDVAALRLNGGDITTTTTDQGTGNYGTYPLFIGARAGTSNRFNGRIYQLIGRGALSDTATLELTETYVNGKTRAF